MMNARVILECSAALAAEIAGANLTVEQALRRLFRKSLARYPNAIEAKTLRTLFEDSFEYYSNHPDQVARLSTGMELDDCDARWAALFVVSGAVFNCDEFLVAG